VRRFFETYNRNTAHLWNADFQVIDWENCSSIGVGRPQELITQQTLEKYKDSLVLVIGIMGQRFGSPSGKAESGTEEEFNWAMQSHEATKFPEIKWFLRKTDKLELPPDPAELLKAVEQWNKVVAFRKRLEDLNNPVFSAEYPGADGFAKVFDRDLTLWLNDPSRPWAEHRSAAIAGSVVAPLANLVPDFDSERYRTAVLKRFEKLNFDMIDTTGAHYSGVRLWSVFVPQSARESHEYNPRLLEIPKEHQKRLLEAGEIGADELAATEQQVEQLRRKYFSQPLRPVVELVDEALKGTSQNPRRLVILGDPGAGKSSLLRYVAVRWARIADSAERAAQPIPLVVDLGSYARWQCEGQKNFVRFLEEAPVWHDWPPGLLERLLKPPGRVVLLLDGLDEIFDPKKREEVVNDIGRFSAAYANTPIFVTSRVVGYQPRRLLDSDFRHFVLQDLDFNQIEEFIDRWHAETFDDAAQAAPKLERLKRAVRDSKSIANLAGNPLLLTMMAILNRNQELPRDRADLYLQASRVLLHQWDTERALAEFPGLRADIGWREKSDMLRRIASFMQAGPSGLKGNMIDGKTLESLIEDYLHTELRFDQSRAAARAVVEHLRQRNFILCFVGADSYGFVHRTFLEYFCAADFVHRFNVTKTLSEEALIALFEQHCGEDEWREVLRLICGQIDEQFVGRIVEHLATRTDLEKWSGGTPLPELPLAIYCLSELRNTARSERAGAALLDRTIEVITKAEFVPDQFLEDLVKASGEIGTRWPGHGQLDRIALPQLKSFSFGGTGRSYWASLIANVTENRSIVVALATSREEEGAFRYGAVRALAEKWPDNTTRTLLIERAIQDPLGIVRIAAVNALVEKWSDDATRTLLTARALEDQDGSVRLEALRSLAEKWPDDATRSLLTTRAVEDQAGSVRLHAVRALAKKWLDDATRSLLTTRAVEDASERVRLGALRSLAGRWADDATRALLTTRAVEDQHGDVRLEALRSLAENWPDEATQGFLRERAVEDPDQSSRGRAAVLAARGESEFARRIYTRDLDGAEPYLDPREPVALSHIKWGAVKAGLAADEVEAALTKLSQRLGWDVTVGARPVPTWRKQP
jgi:hypothetical protein